MNDLESKLHDLLQDRASRQRTAPQAPPEVLRRVRRRQVGTALVSGVTAIAVIGGTVLGLQAFGKGKPSPNPAAESGVGDTRTVNVHGFGLTYPRDWALQTVSVGIAGVEPGAPEQPVQSGNTADGTGSERKVALVLSGEWLQLSNLYPDHLLDATCDGSDLPPDGVVFLVHAVAVEPGSVEGPGGLQPDRECPDGATTYTATVASGAFAYRTEAKFGPESGESDRQALLAAYDSISFPSGDTGVIGGVPPIVSEESSSASGQETAGSGTAAGGSGSDGSNDSNGSIASEVPQSILTVVAGGTTDTGTHWVILTDRTLSQLEVEAGDIGWGVAQASAGTAGGEPPSPPVPNFQASVSGLKVPGLDGLRLFVSGSAVSRAVRVEVRPDGQDPIDVPLEPAPAVTGIDRSYFLMDLPESTSSTGTVVALDTGGAVIGSQDYAAESTLPPTCPTPVEGSDGSATKDPCTAVTLPAPADSGSAGSGQEPISGGGMEPNTAVTGGSSAESGTATAEATPSNVQTIGIVASPAATAP
jgi:hypothetical protein